ncbi:probable G-protein coupled receptor 139 [Carcharodon carcharias]|uniref:probable G-protein coupled receptor 139 n=1 Tax=Carcharodon carcharias TaxID=13397 RepID=UPI001B7EC44E|nr:probable G-protein coupled receptor 139 [Carcharodon carcharias]
MGRAPILYLKEIGYPIVAVFGIPATLMTAVILSQGKCGLSKGITRYMVAMAISNLLVIIFHVVVQEILAYYFPYSFVTQSSICPSHAYLKMVTMDYSVWLTISFTFDRFISICCQKLRHRYCTERNAVVVIVSICVLSIIKFIPCHFMYEPRFMIDNTWWGCKAKSAYFTSVGWMAFSWVISLSIALLPFFLILLLNGLTARHILVTSRVRRALKGLGSGQNQSDDEIDNRQKSIILLFAVSGSYILFWMTISVTFLSTRIAANGFVQSYSNPSYIANEVGMFLMHIATSVNTCVYGMTQRKFREEVKKVVKYSLTPFSKLIKLKLQLPRSQTGK